MEGYGDDRDPRAPGGSPPKIQPMEAAEEDRGDDDDFEFAFVCDDRVAVSTADEIFCNGVILPVYPLFGRNVFIRPSWFVKKEEEGEGKEEDVRKSLRNLMVEEKKESAGEMFPSCSSSESDELDGLPEDSYCLWNPGSVPTSPDLRKKSMSTGSSTTSSSRRWRFRDLVAWRSRSDGEKRFAFIRQKPQPETPAAKSDPSRSDGTLGNSVELGVSRRNSEDLREPKRRLTRRLMALSAHRRVHHLKGGEKVADGGDQRRSYLPHRNDLAGLT